LKANTRRENRLAFNDVADLYDDVRPALPGEVVADVMRLAGLRAGDPVLEVGAGSGQLTLPLRTAGLRVTALEPGEQLRAHLEKRAAADDQLDVTGGLFEDYRAPAGRFAAVWSANAWQWIDPAVSYRHAARLLGPAGHLVLLWNFPILADPHLQTAMNAAVTDRFPDAVRDPGTHLSGIETRATEGRAELAASNAYEAPWARISTHAFTLAPDTYARLLLTYASTAAQGPDAAADLTDRITRTLAAHDVQDVVLDNIVYACVARKRTEP
jgi:SAM-dependent methyltransferase